jgi:hypothetical protein
MRPSPMLASMFVCETRAPQAFHDRHPRGGVIATLFQPGGNSVDRRSADAAAGARHARHPRVAASTRMVFLGAAEVCGASGGGQQLCARGPWGPQLLKQQQLWYKKPP